MTINSYNTLFEVTLLPLLPTECKVQTHFDTFRMQQHWKLQRSAFHQHLE
jgi:hypothetical protein